MCKALSSILRIPFPPKRFTFRIWVHKWILCLYLVDMRHKWILCLYLSLIPKISNYVYANIPKSEHLRHFWSQGFWIRDVQSVSRSGSTGLQFLFNFIRQCWIIFPKWQKIVHSIWLPLAPFFLPALGNFRCLDFAHLVVGKWYLILVLICVS
jgi:hypothetical protein